MCDTNTTAPTWVTAVKPSWVAWDESPIDVSKLDEHGVAPLTHTVKTFPVMTVPAASAASELPLDLIGAVVAFAKLRQEPEGFRDAAVAFCQKYGPLGVAETFSTERHAGRVTGESIARWSEENQAFFAAVNLLRYLALLKLPRKRAWWLSLIADPASTFEINAKYQEVASSPADGESSRARRARAGRASARMEKDKAKQMRAAARARLAAVVTEGLNRANIRVALVVEGEVLKLAYPAPSLLARMWLRVALAASKQTKLLECKNCGELLLPQGPRKRDRMRSDRQTCSARCRQAWKRRHPSRKTKAVRSRTPKGA